MSGRARSYRRRSAPEDRDRAVVRRAGRRAAWLAASLVAVSFVLCGGLVFLVVVTGQDRDARAQLQDAAVHADDVGDPPEGISLLLRHSDGRTEITPGAPPVLPYRPAISAVLAAGSPAAQVRDVDAPAGDFRIWTQRRTGPEGIAVAQAALSLRPLEQERIRLLGGLLAAAALALVAAAALGAFSGRQTASGLVAALRRQRQFVADASHELRTPLTVVSTRAQLLARHLANAPLDESTRRLLTADVERLLADSSGLADVVEDLLAASEPDTDGTGCADLRTAAQDAVASLGPLGVERGIAVTLADLGDGGPPDGAPVQVTAGAPPLRRSLMALIDNAVRHSPDGGTVTVACGLRNDRGVVTVSDTGPGIPARVRTQLFDRFASGDRQADHGASTETRRRYGLGLALVADTVHRFSGDVTVDTGSSGTTFTLSLPRCREHDARRDRHRAVL
ncbi:MAG: histidine kinase [Blastococcus sp.]|nr:histidine kinase [Blastococcus sp.]